MAALPAFLHVRLAFALVLLSITLGIWGSYQYLRHRAVSGGFRATYLMLVGLTLLQGLVGALTFGLGLHPRNLLHVVYGIFAAVFLPGIYFYSSRGGRDREAVFLAASCWVVVVAYVRGYTTGH